MLVEFLSSSSSSSSSVSMEQTGDFRPSGLRQLNLSKSFKLGIRSLLTTCSRKDILNAFSTFNKGKQEALFQKFIQVLTSLHQIIEEEFESVFLETQVGTILDTVEQLVEEQTLDIVSNDMTSLVDVKQEGLKAKKDEITYLTNMLEKVLEHNQLVNAQIDALKKERLNSLSNADAVVKFRSWNTDYGQP